MPPRKMVTRRRVLAAGAAVGAAAAMNPVVTLFAGQQQPAPLERSWAKNFLTIRGRFPGDEIKIMYLEAYCRPESTDRDWSQTVISHTARQLPATDADASIHLEDVLADGIVVRHVIKATADEVDFRIVAHNPTNSESQAAW